MEQKAFWMRIFHRRFSELLRFRWTRPPSSRMSAALPASPRVPAWSPPLSDPDPVIYSSLFSLLLIWIYGAGYAWGRGCGGFGAVWILGPHTAIPPTHPSFSTRHPTISPLILKSISFMTTAHHLFMATLYGYDIFPNPVSHRVGQPSLSFSPRRGRFTLQSHKVGRGKK